MLELGIFPEKDDTCWIRGSDILCTIEHPVLTSRRGGYSISQESMSKATKAYNLCEKSFNECNFTSTLRCCICV